MTRAAVALLLLFCSADFAAAGDAALEGLEKEATRLAEAARAGKLTAAQKLELFQSQASFRKTLAACRDAKPCLQRTLLERIHRLRQGYAEARSKDSEGTSLGPFTTVCPRLDSPVAVTFVNIEPSFAFLSWREHSVVLQQAVAASGARYTGAYGGGEAQFWNKGQQATLDLPGQPSLSCTMQDGG
jgi:hypothetical protein